MHAGQGNGLAGGRHAEEFAVLVGLAHETGDDTVMLRDDFLDGDMQVGKHGTHPRGCLLDAVTADGLSVDHEVWRDDSVGGGEVGVVKDFVVPATDERLVVVEHSAVSVAIYRERETLLGRFRTGDGRNAGDLGHRRSAE